MTEAELVGAYSAARRDVTTLAFRDLVDVWNSTPMADPAVGTGMLVPAVQELTDVYGRQTAVLAADFYDDARNLARPRSAFTATVGPSPEPDRVAQMTRWAVVPMFGPDPRFGAALERLAGGTGRLIRQAGDDTVVTASQNDPDARGWARNAQPGACQFCRMLADRGAVYRKTTARFAAHDNCACTASPVWDPNRVEAVREQYVASQRTRSPQQKAELRAYLNANFPR